MMKRKLSILTLAFLFFTATTGLPVTLHYCNMMESASMVVCEMHKIEVEKSCCESEMSDSPLKITSDTSPCCQNKLIYNKIDDEFLFSKSNVSFFSSSEILLQQIAIITNADNFNFTEPFYNDSSPPFLIDPDLHITNSVFLI